jgi:hypothetical protein
MRIQRHFLWLALLLAPACASGAGTGANLTRSPTLDYPPPPAQTSDGQVVGADGVPPERKLATSPKIGNGGLTPAATPATLEEVKPETLAGPEDPQCAVLGMSDVVRKARCHAPAPPPPTPAPKR